MNVASEHRVRYVEYYVYVKDSQKRVVIKNLVRSEVHNISIPQYILPPTVSLLLKTHFFLLPLLASYLYKSIT